MKFYNSVGPNPKVVRMFMAERGMETDMVEVDLMAGENRKGDYLKKNPAGQLPALELDNGDVISEITVICEYLEEKQGASSLIGTSAEERAETRMWVRRIDLGIMENLANGFRFSEGQDLFKDRMSLIPHAADDLKAIAQEKINQKLAEEELRKVRFMVNRRFGLGTWEDIIMERDERIKKSRTAAQKQRLKNKEKIEKWFEITKNTGILIAVLIGMGIVWMLYTKQWGF